MQPMSGVSKERVTLWSGCIGLKALAGFLGQLPKPLGRAHNYESEACVVIVGYNRKPFGFLGNASFLFLTNCICSFLSAMRFCKYSFRSLHPL